MHLSQILPQCMAKTKDAIVALTKRGQQPQGAKGRPETGEGAKEAPDPNQQKRNIE